MGAMVFALESSEKQQDRAISAFCNYIFKFGGLDEPGWIFADGQGVEMCLTAFNLGAFAVAEIIGKQAALGFDDEVKAFRTIFFH
jgi:hypothetical protein